jgi:hypothetical protein
MTYVNQLALFWLSIWNVQPNKSKFCPILNFIVRVFSSDKDSPLSFKKLSIALLLYSIPSGFKVINKKSSANLTRCVDANKLVFVGRFYENYLVAGRILLINIFPSVSVTDPILGVKVRPSKVQFLNNGDIIPP